LPPCRRLGGLRPDAVNVVAEGDVELRPVPERAVDEIRVPGVTQRVMSTSSDCSIDSGGCLKLLRIA
jgi:hypothetical protein